ncbi:MAG: hypothetical protein CMH52_13960 [Myxococcales bacterium]|nr:hypothetical protein [Myxococcales bacterium]
MKGVQMSKAIFTSAWVVWGSLLALLTVGCTSSDETAESESLVLIESDYYESGRLKPHSYHKSSIGYPDFRLTERRWMGEFPQHCDGLVGEEAYACAEQIFWHVFQFDLDGRAAAHDTMGELIARLDAEQSLEPELLAVLYWRRAQLGTALITEQELVTNGDYTNETLISYGPGLTLDMQKGMALAPGNDRIETWLITNQLFASVLFGGDVTEMAEDLVALYDEDPGFVVASAGPPLIAMPLSSGWPQRIAQMYLDFDESIVKASCDGECFAPGPLFAKYTREGADYTMAEIMARVGDREKTKYYLERSLSHDTADVWPHRDYPERALNNLDSFIGKFEARGQDEPVFDLMDINGKHACLVCHNPK